MPREKINRQLENSTIINNVVNDILLNETQKVSYVRESPEFLGSDYDENDIYQDERMSLEDTKNKLEWRKRAF